MLAKSLFKPEVSCSGYAGATVYTRFTLGASTDPRIGKDEMEHLIDEPLLSAARWRKHHRFCAAVRRARRVVRP